MEATTFGKATLLVWRKMQTIAAAMLAVSVGLSALAGDALAEAPPVVTVLMSGPVSESPVTESLGAAVLTGGAIVAADQTAPTDTPPAELGPAIGARLPHDLEVPDGASAGMDFSELAGPSGLALVFVRSLDWCPYCKAQAADIGDRMAEFQARGLNVAVVSYDAPDKQALFVKRTGFKGQLISDPSIAIVNAFGLRNPEHAEGSRFYGIPHPAVFVIGADGVIKVKLYEEDFARNAASYQNRPPVDAILAAADAALKK